MALKLKPSTTVKWKAEEQAREHMLREQQFAPPAPKMRLVVTARCVVDMVELSLASGCVVCAWPPSLPWRRAWEQFQIAHEERVAGKVAFRQVCFIDEDGVLIPKPVEPNDERAVGFFLYKVVAAGQA